MKKLTCFLLLLNSLMACRAQTNNNNLEIKQQLDKIVTGYVNDKTFIGSVLIANNGNILLNKGYGFADIENKIPNTPTTNFYLASVSKLFTVACIAILEEQGRLSYDDPLTKYIPDYPEGGQITIQHLIKHKSGIVDVVNERPFVYKTEYISLDELIEEFKYMPLNFTPGERSKYSNSGYLLLAYIIEKVSGMSYSDFIKTNIFDPLKMTSSYSQINMITAKMG